MPTYFVSLQKHFTPFNNPELPALLHTLRARFTNDDQLTVIPMHGANLGYFKIIVSKPPPEGGLTLPVMVEGKSVDLPLITENEFQNLRGNNKGARQWAEGTLVTMYNSSVGPLSTVMNKDFDTLLAVYGEVTRATQLQTHKGTDVLNGNRYCVLKHSDDLPDQISVPDPNHPGKFVTVSLGYKGKEKFCVRCMKRHSGTCAELIDFYKARDLRKEQDIANRILSDSTLRHADETGLNSNLLCMSGGRIGNISHIIQDDQTMVAVKQVIVVAGQNDLLRDEETLEDFKTIVDKSVDLLQQLSFKHHLTVVQPLIPPGCHALVKQKAAYLDDLCNRKSTDTALPLLYVNNLPQIEMSGIHPTIDGTAQLLQWIDKRVKIITDGRFITDAKMYRGGRSIYKYGCLLCPKYLHLDNSFICPDCGLTHYPPLSGETVSGHGEPSFQQPGAAPGQPIDTDSGDVIMNSEKGLLKRPLHEDSSLGTPRKQMTLTKTDVTSQNDDENRVY